MPTDEDILWKPGEVRCYCEGHGGHAEVGKSCCPEQNIYFHWTAVRDKLALARNDERSLLVKERETLLAIARQDEREKCDGERFLDLLKRKASKIEKAEISENNLTPEESAYLKGIEKGKQEGREEERSKLRKQPQMTIDIPIKEVLASFYPEGNCPKRIEELVFSAFEGGICYEAGIERKNEKRVAELEGGLKSIDICLDYVKDGDHPELVLDYLRYMSEITKKVLKQ